MSDGPTGAPRPIGAPAGPDAVYQELILDHFRRPRHHGAHPAPDGRAEQRNPLCGDEVTVTVLMDGPRVREVLAESRGCSVAAASASMMTVLAAGRTGDEVAALRGRLEALLAGDRAAAADPTLGDLRALSGLARVPGRHRCALLPWEALRRALVDVPRGPTLGA